MQGEGVEMKEQVATWGQSVFLGSKVIPTAVREEHWKSDRMSECPDSFRENDRIKKILIPIILYFSLFILHFSLKFRIDPWLVLTK